MKDKNQNSVGLFKIKAHLKYGCKKLFLPHAALYLMVLYIPKRRYIECRQIGLPKCRDANSAFRIPEASYI